MTDKSPFQVQPHLQAILRSAEEEAWIRVSFNGHNTLLPAGTILTMAHCVVLTQEGNICLNVETSHLDWMRSRLVAGCVFLDVGSATGAMTIPIAIEHPEIQVVAFEPAERARRLLKATLVKNDLLGVSVVPCAISDTDGSVSFADRGISEDGSVPFLPETSTIVAEGHHDTYGDVVTMETLSLNTVCDRFGLSGRRVVVKIDIEGFEIKALCGADRFLANCHASLAIDIHVIPNGDGRTTEQTCREILSVAGYSHQEMMGHVLLAEKNQK